MAPPGYNEADTRAKLIDPALHARQWIELVKDEHRATHGEIHREQSAIRIDILDGKPLKRGRGRVDYLLRAYIEHHEQPLTLAFIEAKKEKLPPTQGLEQVKEYARRHAVKFVYSTNGHLFVEYDTTTGKTTDPRPMAEFPTPAELRQRWFSATGLDPDAAAVGPLLTAYSVAGDRPRYYQDAAIRAVLERAALAAGGKEKKRALLSLATGAGKTSIAVGLLQRLSDGGQLKRALFLVDRDELREQALTRFHNVFGSDAKIVREGSDGGNEAKNARIHIATYQSLGIHEHGDASFLRRYYPENHFSHILIDECHRSAWGTWSEVLTRNPEAFQIGLTATPRELTGSQEDHEISADNIRHFGEPVYDYSLAQGIEDGYLAPCEIKQGRVSIDEKTLIKKEVIAHKAKRVDTGQRAQPNEVRDVYSASDYDAKLQIPERVIAMCDDLFQYLLETGGPEQKTIVFCAADTHADRVAAHLNNRYAEWCKANGRARAEPYAFKCTSMSSGNKMVADLRGTLSSWFVATTVDLLSTGVDVPCVRNIVFFRYLESAIVFHQMVGRGTRIDEASGKLMFRLYDYTNMIRLFGRDFITPPPRPGGGGGGGDDDTEPTLIAGGFSVRVERGGHFVLGERDGRLVPVAYEEYKRELAARLKHEAASLAEFRERWITPPERQELMAALVSAHGSPTMIQMVDAKQDYDLYDVLAELGYAVKPRTRLDRSLAFRFKNESWLDAMPSPAKGVILGIAGQFERNGTEALENREIWRVPAIQLAGGLAALRGLGKPLDALHDAKTRLFSA
ncbi:MAG: DEAD/DEAH box helicase family protein [Denitratisoma sp.]|nr:DEAD/DEAH box helicase family protein [Denitratisoma sp.]